MILLSPDFELAWQTVLDAVKEGRIPENRIDKSLRRILRLKKELNVAKNRSDLRGISEFERWFDHLTTPNLLLPAVLCRWTPYIYIGDRRELDAMAG